MTRLLAALVLFALPLIAREALADDGGGLTFALREGYLRNEGASGGEHAVSELVVGGRLSWVEGFGVHLRGRLGLAADIQTPRDELNDRTCSAGSSSGIGGWGSPASCGIDIDWRFPVGLEVGAGYMVRWRLFRRLGVSLGFDASLSLTYLANTYERVASTMALGGLVDTFVMADIGERGGIGLALGGLVERDDASGLLWLGMHFGIRAYVNL